MVIGDFRKYFLTGPLVGGKSRERSVGDCLAPRNGRNNLP